MMTMMMNMRRIQDSRALLDSVCRLIIRTLTAIAAPVYHFHRAEVGRETTSYYPIRRVPES